MEFVSAKNKNKITGDFDLDFDSNIQDCDATTEGASEQQTSTKYQIYIRGTTPNTFI